LGRNATAKKNHYRKNRGRKIPFGTALTFSRNMSRDFYEDG